MPVNLNAGESKCRGIYAATAQNLDYGHRFVGNVRIGKLLAAVSQHRHVLSVFFLVDVKLRVTVRLSE